jgi:hypothetical protein
MPLQLYLVLLFVSRILALEKLGAVFNQVAYNLDFTPRKFVVHAESGTGNQFFLFFSRYLISAADLLYTKVTEEFFS